MLLDIFSRYVVGWLLADRESATLARRLIKESCEKEGIAEAVLTLHSDRGPAMTSKTVGQLLADLSITRSLTRPYTSNDNPFSESQFRTLKSRPEFPERFGSQQDALGFLRRFFPWYNEEHRHSGIGFLTPASVHSGTALAIVARREETLAAAFAAHPERFKGKTPRVQQPPTEVWINPPALDRNGVPSTRSRRNVALRIEPRRRPQRSRSKVQVPPKSRRSWPRTTSCSRNSTSRRDSNFTMPLSHLIDTRRGRDGSTRGCAVESERRCIGWGASRDEIPSVCPVAAGGETASGWRVGAG